MSDQQQTQEPSTHRPRPRARRWGSCRVRPAPAWDVPGPHVCQHASVADPGGHDAEQCRPANTPQPVQPGGQHRGSESDESGPADTAHDLHVGPHVHARSATPPPAAAAPPTAGDYRGTAATQLCRLHTAAQVKHNMIYHIL